MPSKTEEGWQPEIPCVNIGFLTSPGFQCVGASLGCAATKSTQKAWPRYSMTQMVLHDAPAEQCWPPCYQGVCFVVWVLVRYRVHPNLDMSSASMTRCWFTSSILLSRRRAKNCLHCQRNLSGSKPLCPSEQASGWRWSLQRCSLPVLNLRFSWIQVLSPLSQSIAVQWNPTNESGGCKGMHREGTAQLICVSRQQLLAYSATRRIQDRLSFKFAVQAHRAWRSCCCGDPLCHFNLVLA